MMRKDGAHVSHTQADTDFAQKESYSFEDRSTRGKPSRHMMIRVHEKEALNNWNGMIFLGKSRFVVADG